MFNTVAMGAVSGFNLQITSAFPEMLKFVSWRTVFYMSTGSSEGRAGNSLLAKVETFPAVFNTRTL